jgi:hypothetical protein
VSLSASKKHLRATVKSSLATGSEERREGLGSCGDEAVEPPVPWQKVSDPFGGIIGQPSEDIGEPGLGVDVVELGCLDEGVDGGGAPPTFV